MDDRDFFALPFVLGRKEVTGRFVVPSGIRAVHGSTIGKFFSDIPSIGVVTTKSLSFLPRYGYREPIYARFSKGSYINAVGLSNPGAEGFLQELSTVPIPENKFLLVSVFGADAAEFCKAAAALDSVADGFELNMSCPHAAGYGIEIGQDVPLMAEITEAVVRMSDKPVFVKLSAALPTIGRTAKAALTAGAQGIVVSNSVGPSVVEVGDQPILSNKVGGLSGNAIRPVCLFSVKTIREALGPIPLIIAMGGIGTAEHVRQFKNAGANLFGIGSALTGLNSADACDFFAHLEEGSETGVRTIGSDSEDSRVPMEYSLCRVVDRHDLSDDQFEIRFDRLPEDPPAGGLGGRYYFLCVPGKGEKPFAVFSASDRSIIVKKVGIFTRHLATLPVGSEILVRGPYGRPFSVSDECGHLVLVGGGTGIASLYEIAVRCKESRSLQFVLGARTKSDLFGIDKFRRLGQVDVATDDGSEGFKGRVPDLLRPVIEAMPTRTLGEANFVNCGPAPMVYASLELQRQFVHMEKLFGSIEYYTSCGVGICGKCASPSGHLTCIDGPFLPAASFYHPDMCATTEIQPYKR